MTREYWNKQLVNFGQDITAQDIQRFVKGGRATFTLESAKTGAHYTYHIHAKDMDNSRGKVTWN